jgi:membrane associated rhomboid family serine protease
MRTPQATTQLGLPRPGKALIGLMLGVLAIWVMFAVGLNWGGVSIDLFEVLTGDTRAVLHGEVWRLLTAPFLHTPSGPHAVTHLVNVELGLYFLGSRLEQAWGPARFLRFVVLTSVLAFLLQMVVELILPTSLGARLVGGQWYGLMPAVTAIAIAWALTFRGQVVQFMMVIPISSGMLIVIIVALSLLRLAAANTAEEGLISPFGGMLFGWLLGGGTPSPLRKAWLKLRLAQLDNEARRDGKRRKARPNPGGLRVIPGGRTEDDDDKGPDGRWLN